MKKYNEKKICFIICANSKQYLNECLLYLSLLEVPEDYETELLVIENETSVTKAYNEAMKASDAKYKIYLPQHVFVTERQILDKIIGVFQKDSSIGLIGLLGTDRLSKDGVVKHNNCCGAHYLDEVNIERLSEEYAYVEAVDGLLMATQYDVSWREDLLTADVMYDTSQSLEYRRAGYKLAVLAQSTEWVKVVGLQYCYYPERERKVILQEYKEFFDNMDKLRILFVHSEEIYLAGLISGFLNLGHEVQEYSTRVTATSLIKKEQEMLEDALEQGDFDLVVSYDFIGAASNACQTVGVKYYAWVYDSPLMALYAKESQNSVNYISVFDKKQYERLIGQGIAHLKYFPLATEVNLFTGITIEPGDEKKYGADVSFLGRLYEKRGFEEIFEGGPQRYLEEAESIVTKSLCQWGKDNPIYGVASEELIEYMASKAPTGLFDVYQIDKRYFCESMKLARKANEYERIKVLNTVAEKYKTVLYTKITEQDALKNIEIRPWVSYLYEMPKVFYLSKINLNISSRSIETGIPQRVWDIMAVGGFCLTNYQAEIDDYFEIGKDIEVYHNLEELMEKIDYYLKHEEARVRIAMNGYKKVRKLHSYEKRLEDILKWIREE